jgi:hypothetical protein
MKSGVTQNQHREKTKVTINPEGSGFRQLPREAIGQRSVRLGDFQPLELDVIGVDVSEVVMGLLGKPTFGAAAEDLR